MDYIKLGKNTVNAVRFAEVLQVFMKHGFADLLQRAGFTHGPAARLLRGLKILASPEGEPATFGQRLCDAFTELGPTFVKFGQILSTRPDIVGPALARDLSELQDAVKPLSFETMQQVVEADLGAPLADCFTFFERTPVASASLSQVYRAQLPEGDLVAVKVQRPGIEKSIDSDLRLMRQLAEWVADHLEEAKRFDPPGIVDEFTRSIQRELDFTIEAQVIRQFDENLQKNEAFIVPEVYPQYSSRRVLTMSWIDGVRVDRFDAYEERGCDRRTIALNCCDVLCDMVFEDRLFHADPHPGNIFIMRDNQVAFLDLGMAGHLEEPDVAAIADLFLAIFHLDSKACVNAVLTLSTAADLENRRAFEHEVAEFIAFEAKAIISGGQIARGIERAIQILRRHHLELAPRFSLLLKALATVETVGRSLDPEIDFAKIMQPYVEKLLLHRFRPEHLIKELQHSGSLFLRLSRQIPDDMGDLLQRLRTGRLALRISHENLDHLAHAMDRSSNRQAVALITAGLIIGSSLLISSGSAMSRIGIAGFVFAGLLGMSLIISILWTRKF